MVVGEPPLYGSIRAEPEGWKGKAGIAWKVGDSSDRLRTGNRVVRAEGTFIYSCSGPGSPGPPG